MLRGSKRQTKRIIQRGSQVNQSQDPKFNMYRFTCYRCNKKQYNTVLPHNKNNYRFSCKDRKNCFAQMKDVFGKNKNRIEFELMPPELVTWVKD